MHNESFKSWQPYTITFTKKVVFISKIYIPFLKWQPQGKAKLKITKMTRIEEKKKKKNYEQGWKPIPKPENLVLPN